ncbi:hypothetical protein CTAM01_08436 [Colletotrichum tamarilloi]|uniref:Uncharacterized protein n=1 Tax=Colletotrichum tamarilloi TaxID=1209934 RepID=A0ABQ9R6B2_9PEZI|nr:uncharacterized protein CTAM01_08436 [Colletotrichum tamarilloi]KAK1496249.1 hypothetical protein CTAM01_08436 [Colletotrichum tamarilloi]
MSSRLRQPSFLARTIAGAKRWFDASAWRRCTRTTNDTLIAFVTGLVVLGHAPSVQTYLGQCPVQ